MQVLGKHSMHAALQVSNEVVIVLAMICYCCSIMVMAGAWLSGKSSCAMAKWEVLMCHAEPDRPKYAKASSSFIVFCLQAAELLQLLAHWNSEKVEHRHGPLSCRGT